MGNTFGNADVSLRLVDPRGLRRARSRFLRDDIPALRLANSFYETGGRYPSRGWILLTRVDYEKITNTYATDFSLEMDSFDTAAPKITLKNLVIVQAQCVSTGVSGDDNAVYLIELTDKRGTLANKWFQFPLNAQYNVLSPAYPENYYSSTMDAGTPHIPWTWNRMIESIWNTMQGTIGTFTGLPITPVGTPMNYIFPGVPAWQNVNDIIEQIGCTVAVDLRTNSSPFTIVSQGESDSTFSQLQSKYAGRLEDDLEWIDTGGGRVPGTVRVFFRRINQYYGTEETVRRDSLQWSTAAVYSVDVSAPAFFSGATGTAILWDNFCVRYTVDGGPVTADVTAAAAIASDRSSQFFNKIYAGTQGYMKQKYSGLIPFQTGRLVDGICWREDFRTRQGWTTTVVRGPEPPFPEIAND